MLTKTMGNKYTKHKTKDDKMADCASQPISNSSSNFIVFAMLTNPTTAVTSHVCRPAEVSLFYNYGQSLEKQKQNKNSHQETVKHITQCILNMSHTGQSSSNNEIQPTHSANTASAAMQ